MKKQVKLVPAAAMAFLFSISQINAAAIEDTSYISLPGSHSESDFESMISTDKQVMYLLNDTEIRKDTTAVSGAVEVQSKGSTVNIIDVDGENAKVLTSTGKIGYVSLDGLTDQPENIFDAADVTLYALSDTELKSVPSASGTSSGTLAFNHGIHIIGTNDYDYWQAEQDGNICYVNKNDLTDYQQPAVSVALASAAAANTAESSSGDDSTVSADTTYTSTWTGAVLTPSAGAIIGPSGKETYYNLDMSGVIAIMQAAGYNYEYAVRSDGVKTYGGYVMVAADFAISGRSRGDLVMTSLGMGIVCDTGTFIYSDPYQIDIAVAW